MIFILYFAIQCDFGVKRNSNGAVEKWKGYKLHVSVADNVAGGVAG